MTNFNIDKTTSIYLSEEVFRNEKAKLSITCNNDVPGDNLDCP